MMFRKNYKTAWEQFKIISCVVGVLITGGFVMNNLFRDLLFDNGTPTSFMLSLIMMVAFIGFLAEIKKS